MHVSLLSWSQHRYLKWGLVITAICIALYVSQWFFAGQPPNGGTWQGYILGTLGALLIVWLSLLGFRKRSYRSTMGTVQGWTSAHVYLGAFLLVIATLHSALQFGWNVHTLAYVLMCLVIVSGFYGLYVYMHLPGRMAINSAEKDRGQWLGELMDLDAQIRDVVQRCDAELQALALSALELTRFGGSAWQQLRARDSSRVVPLSGGKPVPNPEQQVVIDALAARVPAARKREEAEVLNELLGFFGRRQVILHVLRKDIQLKALVKIWLYLHIPLTVALLVALLVHILSVFIYW
jgi:hypothetical protein